MPGPDDERIDIAVVLSDMTSPEAENVDRKLKNIEDSADSSSGSLEDLGTTVDENGKKWRRFGGILRREKRTIDDTGKAVDGTRKKVKGLGDETVSTEKKVAKSTRGMKRSFGGLWKMLRRIRSLAMFGIKWGVIADGVGFLGTALKGLGAGAYAAVAGLSPLVGILGAFPGMIATMVQSMGTIKLATAGIGKAVEVMANPEATVEEYKEATKDLHAEQIRFAQSVATSIPIWKELRKEVGGRFFKNMGPWYMQLTKRYQPLLNEQLGVSADIWNDILVRSAEYLNSKKGYETFGDVLEGNNRVMANGSGILVDGLRGTLVFLRAASPMLETMASDFSRWTNNGADWLETNESRVTAFLERSWQLGKDVGNVLGDMFVGLYNIGKLSKPLSRYMGKNTEEAMENFRAWTESKKGRTEIKQFFKDMKPVVRELALWARDLLEAGNDISLGNGDFVKLSKGLRNDALPMIVDLVQAFQGYALPMLVEGAEIYGNLKEAGVTGGMGRAFSTMVDGIGEVAKMAANMPDAAKNLVAFASGLGAAYAIVNRFSGPSKLINKITGGRFGRNGITPVFVTNWPTALGGKGTGSVIGGGGNPKKPGAHRKPTVGSRVRGSFRGLGLPGLALGIAGASAATSKNQAVRSGGHAALGASAGSMFGPVGTGIGALGGLTAGALIDERRAMAERKRQSTEDPMYILDKYMAGLKAQQESKADSLRMGGGKEMGNPFYNATNLKNSQDALRGMDEQFEKLTGYSIPTYNAMLNDLPKDVQTKIMTPGALDSNKEMKELLRRFDMTPKQKQTALRLAGAEESITRLRDVKAMIDALQDKVVRINIERTQTLISNNAGGIGKAEMGGAYFTGGQTHPGKWYLTGEGGPEAWVSRSGAIKMLGMNGPEMVKPGSGAVVNNAATRNPFSGDSDQSPEWAVAALQRAVGSSARKGASEGGGTRTAVPVSVSVGPIYASSDVDVERAVKKALRDIQNDEDERG